MVDRMSEQVNSRPNGRARGRAATGRFRRRPSWALRGTCVAAASLLVGGVTGAQPAPAQSIDQLRAKAAQIADDLRRLDHRTSELDEDFNDANLRLQALRADLAANEAEVAAARDELADTEGEVRQVALRAYVGLNERDDSFLAAADLNAEASRRRAFLSARYGDRSDAIEALTAAQQDLADREAQLQSASREADAEVARLDGARAELERAVAERRALQESVKGELAEALRAEQARLERVAAERAAVEARAAAQRATAARQAQATAAVRVSANRVATVAAPKVAPPVDVAASPRAQAAIAAAMAQQGKPYKWAGVGPNSFDCSGLMMWAYRAAGVSLPHSSRAIRSMTRSISASELQPGDFVFGGSPVHHVGLYIGNGQMVHAPHSGDVVKVASMYSTSKPVTFGRL